jgi:hypothetical protein
MRTFGYVLPLISVEGLDVKSYPTQFALETSIEHWWVDQKCGLVFDAAGRKLRVAPKPPSVEIVGLAETNENNTDVLKEAIVKSLQSVHVPIENSCTLSQAIEALLDREREEQKISPNLFGKLFNGIRD